MKRKAKEQLASGMTDIQQALAALEDPLDISQPQEDAPAKKSANDMETDTAKPSRPTASSKAGKIGEGKGVTLTKAQRKRAL